MFLRELIRSDDAGKSARDLVMETDLQMAAGGCRDDRDLEGLRRYAETQGWVKADKDIYGVPRLYFLNPDARIYAEKRPLDLDQERQGFVAMSFAPCLKHYVFELGIKPALEAAGYEAFRIDGKAFTGDVVDEILAEIRKSRFVVADFTACKECTDDQPCNGAPGGVYYEAGFAQGLDIPVFLSCRKGCAKAVHFDIDHFKRIEWETPKDLQEQLKNSIGAVLNRAPQQ